MSAGVGVRPQNELRHGGDEPLPFALHDVDHGRRRVYDLRELPYALAGLGDYLGADDVLIEVAALGKLCVRAV